jgi:hypothetical protein
MARFNFTNAVSDGLRHLGARQGGPYGWQLDTVAGILNITPYDNWVACRFDEVQRANQTIGFGTLNRYSGKWNWHFDKPTRADAVFVLAQLERATVSAATTLLTADSARHLVAAGGQT